MEDRFPSNTPLKVPLYSDNKNSCAAVKFVSSLGFTLEILVFISRLTSQASGKQFYTFLRKSHKKTPIKEDASQSVSSMQRNRVFAGNYIHQWINPNLVLQ